MKKLWNIINRLETKKSMKNRIFLVSLIFVNIVIGGTIWLLIGRLLLPGIDWLICFMGYPVVFIGFFGGVLYLYNHEFA